MVKFKQLILQGDRGSDITAVKRILRKRGYDRQRHTNKADDRFEHAIRALQHHHKLAPDGIYGKRTHALLEKDFSKDRYASWLYNRAKIRHRSEYVNPFRNSKGLQVGRVDMGVDYHGYGPIEAVGDGVITGIGGAGWPGGHYINMKLTSGRHAGKYVYLAEAIEPAVRVGQKVKAGQVVAHFLPNAAPGTYPGIEYGWGSPVTNLTYAAQTGHIGGTDHAFSPAGVAFARFLRAVGAPAPAVQNGPEFP